MPRDSETWELAEGKHSQDRDGSGRTGQITPGPVSGVLSQSPWEAPLPSFGCWAGLEFASFMVSGHIRPGQWRPVSKHRELFSPCLLHPRDLHRLQAGVLGRRCRIRGGLTSLRELEKERWAWYWECRERCVKGTSELTRPNPNFRREFEEGLLKDGGLQGEQVRQVGRRESLCEGGWEAEGRGEGREGVKSSRP